MEVEREGRGTWGDFVSLDWKAVTCIFPRFVAVLLSIIEEAERERQRQTKITDY
jgi:hypothetical protein